MVHSRILGAVELYADERSAWKDPAPVLQLLPTQAFNRDQQDTARRWR
jgi:hypothetical protein